MVPRRLAVVDERPELAEDRRGHAVGIDALRRLEAALDALGQVDLLLGLEERDVADLAQVEADGVVGVDPGQVVGVMAQVDRERAEVDLEELFGQDVL